MSSEEEFVVSEEYSSDSDYEDKKKPRRSLSGAKLGNKKQNPRAAAKQGKQAKQHEADDFQVVKRSRRSNDNLTDDEIRAQVLECFAQRAEWTKKNLRLTLGIQLWKFQKFLDEMCDLDTDEGKYYTLKQGLATAAAENE